MIHPRTTIEDYTVDLIVANTDVGGRVYLNHTQDIDHFEMPCILVNFPDEEDTFSQGPTIPEQYNRTLTLKILIVMENPVDPNKGERIGKLLNSVGREIEVAMFNDPFYAKRLSTYTGSYANPKLLSRLILIGVVPIQVQTGERTLAAQELTYQLSYLDAMFKDFKPEYMTEYDMEIRKAGYDEDTVDPVLIAAEGDLE